MGVKKRPAARRDAAPKECEPTLDVAPEVPEPPEPDTAPEVPLEATSSKPKPTRKRKTNKAKTQASAEGSATPAPKPKRKKKQEKEENPFDLPPDGDQQKVDVFFESSNPREKSKGASPATEAAAEPGKNSSSSSSSDESSPSSSSSHATRVAAVMGTLDDDDDDDDVFTRRPCNVQPDQIRTRMQMFGFPARHVQRIKKHWGPDAVLNLEKHLTNVTWSCLFQHLLYYYLLLFLFHSDAVTVT